MEKMLLHGQDSDVPEACSKYDLLANPRSVQTTIVKGYRSGRGVKIFEPSWTYPWSRKAYNHQKGVYQSC